MAKNPTRVTTTTSGMDGDTVVIEVIDTPSAPVGNPPLPGLRDGDEVFLARCQGATPEERTALLEDYIWHYRNITDGVTWEMVGHEQERMVRLVEGLG